MYGLMFSGSAARQHNKQREREESVMREVVDSEVNKVLRKIHREYWFLLIRWRMEWLWKLITFRKVCFECGMSRRHKMSCTRNDRG